MDAFMVLSARGRELRGVPVCAACLLELARCDSKVLASAGMPVLHVRNVPARVVATLKRRAKENGRSLNAEVVQALRDYAERETHAEAMLRQLEEFRREWLAPPDAPTAVELIRAGREERERRLAGDL